VDRANPLPGAVAFARGIDVVVPPAHAVTEQGDEEAVDLAGRPGGSWRDQGRSLRMAHMADVAHVALLALLDGDRFAVSSRKSRGEAT